MKFSLSIPALLTIFIFSLVFGYSIFTDGMFYDGLAYASVSNNLAHGIGTFWNMSYTQTLHTPYYEQPPLTFFIQSVFYKALGDGLWVERLYCFLFAMLMGLLITKTWRLIVPGHQTLSWFPVLIWISFPIVSWNYQNNLQEVTMGLFCALAVYFFFKGCKTNHIVWILSGSLCVFCASFCKGIQGLFPIIVPLFYHFAFKQYSLLKSIGQTCLAIIFPVIIYSAFYFYPEANYFYQHYFERRLLATFQGAQDTTTSHFYLLYKLGTELIVPLLLLGIIWLFFRKSHKFRFENKREALFFSLIGVSASFPLMITLEQRPFYLATAMPYFALAIGFGFNHWINEIFGKSISVNNSKFHSVIIALTGLVILSLPLVSQIPKRDASIINDINLLKTKVAPYTALQVSHEVYWHRWNIHGYMMRYGKFSLDEAPRAYYLAAKQEPPPLDSCFKQLDLELKEWILYECE